MGSKKNQPNSLPKMQIKTLERKNLESKQKMNGSGRFDSFPIPSGGIEPLSQKTTFPCVLVKEVLPTRKKMIQNENTKNASSMVSRHSAIPGAYNIARIMPQSHL